MGGDDIILLYLGPLIILLVLNVFVVFSGGAFIGGSFTSDVYGVDLYFDPLIGAVGWFIPFGIAMAIVSINVVGSGLGESGASSVRNLLMFGGIWTVFSVSSLALFDSIPIYGNLIYVVLTIVYAIGVFIQIGGT